MKRLIAMIALSFWLSGFAGSLAQAADPILPAEILRDARAGNVDAQLEMGILYEYGFRMQGNRVVALAWYQLAAAKGDVRAVRYRDRLTSKLSTAQVAAARKQSATLIASVN